MPKSTSGDSSSKRTSKVDPLRLLVGVESDAEIARRAGVVPETVRIYRIRHGIPSAREASGPSQTSDGPAATSDAAPKRAIPQPNYPELTAEPPRPRRAGVASPIDPYAHLLGTMPDTVLASRIGVTRGAVYQYRRHRGIAAFGDDAVRQVASEVPASVVARSGKGSFSFVVVAAQGSQQKSYAVIATDIVDATNKAMGALPSGARLVSVTQHLELL